MKNTDMNIEKLGSLLDQLRELIIWELGNNPYDELEKARKIIAARNFSQLASIEKKMKSISIALYNRRFSNMNSINEVLNQIEFILSE